MQVQVINYFSNLPIKVSSNDYLNQLLVLQEEGDNGLSGTGLSSTRAVYQCWFGLELEPAESEVRYCIQGKWTGENPQCGMY